VNDQKRNDSKTYLARLSPGSSMEPSQSDHTDLKPRDANVSGKKIGAGQRSSKGSGEKKRKESSYFSNRLPTGMRAREYFNL
jgi:hypothetical protein